MPITIQNIGRYSLLSLFVLGWTFPFFAPTLQAQELASSRSENEIFEKTVRPLLVEHCQSCHGPKKQQSGLRLDTRDFAFKGGESGPAIVVGKPKESLLWQIIQPGADKRMPPKAPLSQAQITAVEAWIARGAHWPEPEKGGANVAKGPVKELWSLKPLNVSKNSQTAKGLSTVDFHIQKALDKAGFKPAPSADKRTLLRRAALVLTGMPPKPETLDEWEKENRPEVQAEAWEKAIRQLWTGSGFGERWARHWMDVARYSDTKGYVFFQDGTYPWSYTYRDWLIQSFRDDLPYDRFVRLQIAADCLLPLGEAKAEDLPALGFLTLGGRFMNNQHDILDDRIDVVTRGLLGLSFTCARCHEHKFDPVPTVDYYSLYSVFASSIEPEVPPLFSAPPKTPEYEAFQKELSQRESKFEEYVQNRYKQMIKRARTDLAQHLLAVRELRGKPPQDEFMLIADPNDPNPTLLKRWRAWTDSPARKSDPAWATWLEIEGFEPEKFEERLRVLTDSPQWKTLPKPIQFSFSSIKPKTIQEAAKAYAAAFTHPFRSYQPVLDKSWVDPRSPWNTPIDAFSDLELFPDREGQGVFQNLRKQVEEWRISGKGAPPRAHALVDAREPRTGRVFLRGNPLRLGQEAPREIPASLGKKVLIQQGSGRLELARIITSPDQPLLARVWVNRVWMICFGQGLVRTPGDFGSRGEFPTHPELLDELTAEFIADGWSTKKLLHKILTSETWKRTSDDPVSQEKDPENRWLARQNPRRLDFESLRDSMLYVSGKLNDQVGGASVRDLQAPRRTLYLHLDRLSVPGLFRTFDFPSPDSTSVSRDQTTTPLQALWLMNNPFAVSCAEGLAKRCGDPAKPEAWVSNLYRFGLVRKPEPWEVQAMTRFVREQGPDGPVKAAQALLASNEFSFVE